MITNIIMAVITVFIILLYAFAPLIDLELNERRERKRDEKDYHSMVEKEVKD